MLFMMRYLSFATFAALLLGGAISLMPDAHAALNDTGIDFCGDAVEGNGPCNGTKPAGQDAQHGRDAAAAAGTLTKIGAGSKGFDFTKIANDGRELPANAALGSEPGDWACTRDNVTGLMWEVKTNDGGLRDQNWSYSWYDSSVPFGNPGTADGGICATSGRCDTQKYVQDVNYEGLCGTTDWRMPGVNELLGIVDYAIPDPGPAIDADFFPNMRSAWFWSASPYAPDARVARFVYFNDGTNAANGKSADYAVRLVRGGQSSETFVDKGDGTVSQTNTGLMWAKCSLGQTGSDCAGAASTMTWAKALADARASRLGGYNDWRLPNLKELMSLVDYTRLGSNNVINRTVFPNTPNSAFWSSSPSASYSGNAWFLSFDDGYVSSSYRSSNVLVRLVRDEQPSNAFALTVAKRGNGAGDVTSEPVGINCGATCTAPFASGTAVTLTAKAASGSHFTGWSGACSGTANCVVTLDAAKTVSANFTIAAPSTFSLAISKFGNGTVTSHPAGIACGTGSGCTANFASGTGITLTATPDSGYQFSDWGGACSGATTCNLIMSASRTVTANFSEANQFLAVAKNGTGQGTVTSLPAGIDCGSDCIEAYGDGTRVTLNANPAQGSVFSGWSGDCVGMGACIVTLDTFKTVTASFKASSAVAHALTVTKNGTGAGTVNSFPDGIACGNDCTEAYAKNTVVGLTAKPANGSTFHGWGGACTGTGACIVTLNAAKTVTATFNAIIGVHYPLTVGKGGTGAGAINSAPAGINCGSDCRKSYASGTVVSLTASPASGSVFMGWRGACSDRSPNCAVTIDAAKRVNAIFNLTYPLTVTKRGPGSVTSSVAGIDCGIECKASYSSGTKVVLRARAASDGIFTGWSGACAGKALTCVVALDAAKAVTANFSRTFALTVAKRGTGAGLVTSAPGGINCGKNCAKRYLNGQTVTLIARPASGSIFTGWSESCAPISGKPQQCKLTLKANTMVRATFTPSKASDLPEQ